MAFEPHPHADLPKLVPRGFVATRGWLMRRGMSRHRLDNSVKSGRLVSVTAGVHALPGTRLVWQGAVCSLQRMGSPLVVGGRTALELHGRAHYIPLASGRTVHLYGPEPPPSWLNRLGLDDIFRGHRTPWLRRPDGSPCAAAPGSEPPFSVDVPWGDGARTIRVSALERALFEVLDGVPRSTSFEHAGLLMESLFDLSPRRLDFLLRRTRSVKIKRLFFWLSDREGHMWAKRLDSRNYDLGRGKRVLARGGRLATEYGITVPEAMHG